MAKDTLIGEVEDGPNIIIRVVIREFRQRGYLDIRKFVKGEGEPQPTRKGITIPQETLEEVFPLIKKGRKILAEELDAIGDD